MPHSWGACLIAKPKQVLFLPGKCALQRFFCQSSGLSSWPCQKAHTGLFALSAGVYPQRSQVIHKKPMKILLFICFRVNALKSLKKKICEKVIHSPQKPATLAGLRLPKETHENTIKATEILGFGATQYGTSKNTHRSRHRPAAGLH